MSNTPQGEATEGNAADDTLMVDQGGGLFQLDSDRQRQYSIASRLLTNHANETTPFPGRQFGGFDDFV
jgi:hypothetical protein